MKKLLRFIQHRIFLSSLLLEQHNNTSLSSWWALSYFNGVWANWYLGCKWNSPRYYKIFNVFFKKGRRYLPNFFATHFPTIFHSLFVREFFHQSFLFLNHWFDHHLQPLHHQQQSSYIITVVASASTTASSDVVAAAYDCIHHLLLLLIDTALLTDVITVVPAYVYAVVTAVHTAYYSAYLSAYISVITAD